MTFDTNLLANFLGAFKFKKKIIYLFLYPKGFEKNIRKRQKGVIYLDFYQPQGQRGIFPWKRMVSFLDVNSARRDFSRQVSAHQKL